MEPKRSVRRKKLRSRKRLNWGAIFVLLLTVNVIYACFNSKITAIRNINLDGVRNSERLRLNRIAAEIKGIPALKVDPRTVEEPFMNESRILEADFRRNVFGVARLILRYRTPVASISGSKQTFLDGTGVVFVDPEEKGIYPIVLLQSKIKVTVFALSGVINFREIAELAKITQTNLPGTLTGAKPVEIEVQETGGVCLNIGDGIVELGSYEQMPLKIKKLRQALEDNPNLLIENKVINLMVPNRLDATPRKKESG
jgi:hypothetical protein